MNSGILDYTFVLVLRVTIWYLYLNEGLYRSVLSVLAYAGRLQRANRYSIN